MDNKFEYNYEAPTSEERKEIENIRNRYVENNLGSDKLNRIRKLDSLVNNTPMILALSLGVIGSLIFGLGMTFFLYWTESFFWGFPFAIIGTIMMIISYPIYKRVHKKLKDKYKEEIIKLSNSLLEE